MVVGFTLPSSSYATIALRELMRLTDLRQATSRELKLNGGRPVQPTKPKLESNTNTITVYTVCHRGRNEASRAVDAFTRSQGKRDRGGRGGGRRRNRSRTEVETKNAMSCSEVAAASPASTHCGGLLEMEGKANSREST
jgi:hypothetical protein